MDTTFTLSTTPHPAPVLTQTLDGATARQLATAMDPPSHDHSWLVVTSSDLTKSKSSMKLLEEIVKLGILSLHTLLSLQNPYRFIGVYTN